MPALQEERSHWEFKAKKLPRLRNDQRALIPTYSQRQQQQTVSKLSRVSAQVDIPSTLFALNVATRFMTGEKYHPGTF
jgi:hypothetical protein